MIRSSFILFIGAVCMVNTAMGARHPECNTPFITSNDARFSRRKLDNHYDIASCFDCCDLCIDKKKCDRWSYRGNRKHCALFGTGPSISKNDRWWMSGQKDAPAQTAAPTPEQTAPPTPEQTAPPTPTPPPVCFGTSSMVTTKSKNMMEQKRIDELKVGDKVMSFNDAGKIIFDEVYYIYHDTPRTLSETEFPTHNISFDDGFVSVTDDHLLYLTERKDAKPSSHCLKIGSENVCTYVASSMTIDDVIWITNGETLNPQTITSIVEGHETVRNPVTLNGNIVANNVASCVYGADKPIDEFLSLPVRAVYRYLPFLRDVLQCSNFQFIWESILSDNVIILAFGLGSDSEKFGQLWNSLFDDSVWNIAIFAVVVLLYFVGCRLRQTAKHA